MQKKVQYLFSSICFALIGSIMISAIACAAEDAPLVKKGPKEIGIAVLCDGHDDLLDQAVALLKREIEEGFGTDFKPVFVAELYGNWQKETILQHIQETLVNPAAAIVLSVGVITSCEIARLPELPKPVIAVETFDPAVMRLPYKDGLSTLKNFTFSVDIKRTEKDITQFKKLVSFQKLHILCDEMYIQYLTPDSPLLAALVDKAVLVPFKKSADETIMALGADVQALYMTPSVVLPAEEYQILINRINERKIPTFSLMGRAGVDMGMLAAAAPDVTERLIKTTIVKLTKILRGAAPESIPVDFQEPDRVIVNMRTAQLLGLSLPFDTLYEYTLLYDQESLGERLTLEQAVKKTMRHNRLIQMKKEEVLQSRKQVDMSIGNYLPQVQYGINYSRYDTQTARSSLGTVPRSEWTHGVQLSQLILSDPDITQIRVSRRSAGIIALEDKTLRLDIVYDAAEAYFSYLKAKAFYRIERQNLEQVRHHFELAEKRVNAGVGSKSEVLRWTSEVAISKSNVAEALARVNTARARMNFLMNAPQDYDFQEQDVDFSNANFVLSRDLIAKTVADNNMFDLLSRFLIVNGIKRSPEVEILLKAIEVQDIKAGQAMRSFFVPEVHAEGSYTNTIEQKSAHDSGVPSDAHDTWFVGLKVSYPLFTGGNRLHNSMIQRSELRRLLAKFDYVHQQVELNIRSALYQLLYSYPNIENTAVAAKSAQENLAITADKYAKGTIPLIDLLDAQHENLIRGLNAASAIYTYFLDIMKLYRAIAHFDFYYTEEETGSFLRAFQQFCANEKKGQQ